MVRGELRLQDPGLGFQGFADRLKLQRTPNPILSTKAPTLACIGLTSYGVVV